MTPADKAKELVDRFDETLTYLESKQKAKQCALICINEMIEEAQYWSRVWEEDDQKRIEELEKVKQEIEKL